MEKELQGKLVEILTSIQSGVGQAKDFALGQLPDIAQSYVAYGRATTTFWCGLSFAALIVIAIAAWQLEKRVDKWHRGFPSFMGCIVAVIPLVGFIANLNSALLVWFAPKVWLLKELAHLVK